MIRAESPREACGADDDIAAFRVDAVRLDCGIRCAAVFSAVSGGGAVLKVTGRWSS